MAPQVRVRDIIAFESVQIAKRGEQQGQQTYLGLLQAQGTSYGNHSCHVRLGEAKGEQGEQCSLPAECMLLCARAHS